MSDYRSTTGFDLTNRTREDTIVDSDGNVRVETVQNCDPIIAAVAAARDLPVNPSIRYVGSIPLVLYTQWMREAGIKPSQPDATKMMMEVIKKKLMSGEYHKLVAGGF